MRSKIKQAIIELVSDSEGLSSAEIRKLLEPQGINRNSIRRDVHELRRKGILIVKDGLNYLINECEEESSDDQKMDMPDSEKVLYERKIQRLEDELKDLKSKYRESHRENSLQDTIVEAIKEYTPRIEVPPPIKLDKPLRTTVTESACLLLSDLHAGEEVLAKHTGGLSEYNFDIFAEYMQSLGQKIVSIIQTNHSKTNIERLYIFMLGDMITGMIHNLMQHVAMTAIQAKNYAAMIIVCLLRDLNRYFPITCNCVVGNHPRLTESKQYKYRAEDNLDYDLYIQVASALMNFPTIKFVIPESFWSIEDIYGWKFLLLHGDDIRSWNQIPWYGILRALKNLQELLDSDNLHFDYACLGHFHNAGQLDRCKGEIILNGSAIGSSDYSIGKLFTGNKPKQMLFGVHEDHGVTWRYPINLMRVEDCAYRINFDLPIHEQMRNAMLGY